MNNFVISKIFLLSLLITLSSFSKNCHGIYNEGKDTTLNLSDFGVDKVIFEKIKELPELKKLSGKKYNGNISILIVQRPDNKFKYYWVQVGIIHPDRFEPIYNFYVKNPTLIIYYYDTSTDSIITLNRWRHG